MGCQIPILSNKTKNNLLRSSITMILNHVDSFDVVI